MISIIIPAQNAENYIEDTIKELNGIKNSEIIVVCNNCKDNTFSKVEEIRKRQKNVKNLNFPFYTGKGGAIVHGLKVAKGDVIGFVDADNAFYSKDIKKVIGLVKKYDCVIASKWKSKKFLQVRQPLIRRVYGRIWNFLVWSLFGLEFKDTQAGLKFLKWGVIDKIGRDFVCSGFEFDVELLWKIKKAGFSIKEIPTNFRESRRSTTDALTILPMVLNLLKLRVRSLV